MKDIESIIRLKSSIFIMEILSDLERKLLEKNAKMHHDSVEKLQKRLDDESTDFNIKAEVAKAIIAILGGFLVKQMVDKKDSSILRKTVGDILQIVATAAIAKMTEPIIDEFFED